ASALKSQVETITSSPGSGAAAGPVSQGGIPGGRPGFGGVPKANLLAPAALVALVVGLLGFAMAGRNLGLPYRAYLASARLEAWPNRGAFDPYALQNVFAH